MQQEIIRMDYNEASSPSNDTSEITAYYKIPLIGLTVLLCNIYLACCPVDNKTAAVHARIK